MTPKRIALTETEQNFANIADALEKGRKPTRARPALFFVFFMALLACVCLGLGYWQVLRLEQKLELISRVEARFNSAPISLPSAAEWGAFDVETYDFQPVRLVGTFRAEQTKLVFTSLQNAKGPRSGVGYWVMTPLALDTGGFVWVNRGFVPESMKDLIIAGKSIIAPEGTQEIIGIARESERPSSFTPGAEPDGKIEYVRNIERLAAALPSAFSPVAPIYVDANQSGADGLPQGGETKIDFPNRHTEYAITWFSLAGVVIVMTAIWLWRRRRG